MLRELTKSKIVETKNKEGNVYGTGMASWKCKYRQDSYKFDFGGNWWNLLFCCCWKAVKCAKNNNVKDK